MKKFRVCNIFIFVYPDDLKKSQLKYFFLLILRVFLGVTIIHFNISAAAEDENTISQELHEDSPIEKEKQFPKETLNRVHDTIKILLSEKIDEKVKYEMKSLWLELEEKILSDNLTTLQIIDLLINKISEKSITPYGRNAAIHIMRELLTNYPLPDNSKVLQIINSLREIISIRVITSYVRGNAIYTVGELSIKYSLPYPEILETLNLLQTEWLLEQKNPHIQIAVIQSTGKILEQYHLPYSEVSQSLDQIKQGLFNRNKPVRQNANQVIEILLKTDKVPDTEKQKIISWVAGHLNDKWWRNRVSALETLNQFLKQDILSDPDDRKELAPMITEQLTHPDWMVQQAAIVTLNTLLKKQGDVLGLSDKKEIVLMLPLWLTHLNLTTRTESIRLSETLFNQIVLSSSERSEIAYITAGLIFDEGGAIRRVASRMTINLLISDFPLPEKLEIISIVSKGFSNTSQGGKRGLNVLKAAKQAGVPLDFNVIHNTTHLISAPFPFGKKAEAFVKESLEDTPFSDEQKLLAFFEIREQLSKRDTSPKEHSNEHTACQESYSSSE